MVYIPRKKRLRKEENFLTKACTSILMKLRERKDGFIKHNIPGNINPSG